MKKIMLVFLLLPLISLAQSRKDLFIKMEIKPIDIKRGYTFEVYKNADEIKIIHKRIDSVGKFSFSEEDKKIVGRLIAKVDIDSMTKDSIDYYQGKLDAMKEANIFYKEESTTIYSTTHKSYFKFIEALVKIPDSVLTAPQGKEKIVENTYCFFTISGGEYKDKRTFYIENLEAKVFPLLTKLVNDTEVIVRSYKKALERKNY